MNPRFPPGRYADIQERGYLPRIVGERREGRVRHVLACKRWRGSAQCHTTSARVKVYAAVLRVNIDLSRFRGMFKNAAKEDLK